MKTAFIQKKAWTFPGFLIQYKIIKMFLIVKFLNFRIFAIQIISGLKWQVYGPELIF